MPRAAKTERNAEIVRLFSEGLSMSEIAQRFGIVRGAVSRVICRHRATVGEIDRAFTPSSHPVGMRQKPTKKQRPVLAPKPIERPLERRSDALLIAEHIASRGVTRCPTRALVATQADLRAA